MPFLTALSPEVKGCFMGAPVEKRLAELKGSESLRDAISIEKTFKKIKAALE